MSRMILPLNGLFQPEVIKHFIKQEEPWHLIAYEAYLTFGTSNHEHEWFAELHHHQIKGLIYHHRQLLHFVYPVAPEHDSPLYSFLQQRFPYFISHGKKEIVEAIVSRLQGRVTKVEEAQFAIQTPQTEQVVQDIQEVPPQYRVRFSSFLDYPLLIQFLKNSSVHRHIDESLISSLCVKHRILLVEEGKDNRNHSRIVGCIMSLKESPVYRLLGGLYVRESERKKGIATLLGYVMLKDTMKRKKKACFYFSDSDLTEFYGRAYCQIIGRWVTYTVE